MRDSPLPAVFAGLSGKIHGVRQVRNDEWSSSCPQCGDAGHKGPGAPDRFRMFTNARGKNKILGWCRRCSFMWFPDMGEPISKKDFEDWRREQIQIEEQRRRSAERAIALLKSERIWMYYHERLTDWSKDVLKSWGIREDWAKYWKLGFIEDYVIHSKANGEYHSPAITIPVWQSGWDVSNVKVRTLNPKDSADRYRSFYKTGLAMPFVAFPALQSDTVLVVEGEKKAMVCAEWNEQKYQVIGIPTKTPRPETLQILEKFGKLIVCLDPDAKEDVQEGVNAIQRFANIVGPERCLVVDLPGKVDDMIVNNRLKINSVVKYAKPMEVK